MGKNQVRSQFFFFLVFFSLTVLACHHQPSSKKPPTQAGQSVAEKAYQDLLHAAERGDYAAVEKMLTPSAIEQLETSDPESQMAHLLETYIEGTPQIRTVEKNQRAILILQGDSSQGITNRDGTPALTIAVVKMIRADGQWKLYNRIWYINSGDPTPEAMAWLDQQ